RSGDVRRLTPRSTELIEARDRAAVRLVKEVHVKWFRDRALTLVLMAMFLVFLAAQMVTGLFEYNATQREHGEPLVSMTDYLATGHPWEALFENRSEEHTS